MVDPYLTKRLGHHIKRGRQAVVSPGAKDIPGYRDNAATSHELAQINKMYQEKEHAIASGIGPSSISEPWYPKVIFASPHKKEDSDES